ncbi:MAG: glycosyltransferase family 4 protein [Candidatus Dormibacterales bacterium]
MRGIGTYVRGLGSELAAQTAFPIEFWGWEGRCPIELGAPHGWLTVPRRWSPRHRGAWLFARRAMRRRASLSAAPLVHVNDPDGLVHLGAKKVVVTVYDLIPLAEGIPAWHGLRRLGYRGYLGDLRRADAILAISHATATQVAERLAIPRERILVAPPGVHPKAPSDGALAPGRPFFLYIGGPNPNKNLGCLLEAMTLTRELREELVIVGAWLPRNHHRLAEELRTRGLERRVRHLGYVSDDEVASLMRASTAVVMPSRFEGFGLPAAEAMAAGAVVVHSTIPVLVSVVDDAGLSFDPESAENLAARLREAAGLSEVRRQEMVRRARLRAEDFTWAKAVRATLDAYTRLLENAR